MLGTGLPIPYSNHTQDNELIVQATEKGMLVGGGSVCNGASGVEKGGVMKKMGTQQSVY